MSQIQVVYQDGRVEVKEVKRWAVQDGCLVTDESFGEMYVPLTNIKKFYPNCENKQMPKGIQTKIG